MGVGPQDGIGEWIGGGQGELPSLPCLSSEDGVEKWPSADWETGPHQILGLPVPGGLPSLQTCEKSMFVAYTTQSMVLCSNRPN